MFPQLTRFCSEHRDVVVPQLTTTVPTGRRGRPRTLIDHDWLRDALSPRRKISLTKLAKVLGVSRDTLRKNAIEAGINYGYSTLTDHQFDQIVSSFKLRHPDQGIRYTSGFVRSNDIRVPDRRVVESLRRVDGLGQLFRKRGPIARRDYKVARPNALWHMDGHHKLIRWGIVIHGIADGFSRKVWFSRTNHSAR